MNKHTLFIADLHLEPEEPARTELFVRFIKEQASQAEALYILGDFFEVWIGDDYETTFNQRIKSALKVLSSQGTQLFFMPGNRDFLIGDRFARQTGCQLLPDPSLITLYGKTLLLTHGDSLCTQDKQHMRLRKLTQKSSLKKLFLLLPIKLREIIARKIRQASQHHTQQTPAQIMDVDPEAVSKMLSKQKVIALIHGHTHKPNIHPSNSKQKAKRIVLGAWHNEGNVLVYSENHDVSLTPIKNQHEN